MFHTCDIGSWMLNEYDHCDSIVNINSLFSDEQIFDISLGVQFFVHHICCRSDDIVWFVCRSAEGVNKNRRGLLTIHYGDFFFPSRVFCHS